MMLLIEQKLMDWKQQIRINADDSDDDAYNDIKEVQAGTVYSQNNMLVNQK